MNASAYPPAVTMYEFRFGHSTALYIYCPNIMVLVRTNPTQSIRIQIWRRMISVAAINSPVRVQPPYCLPPPWMNWLFTQGSEIRGISTHTMCCLSEVVVSLYSFNSVTEIPGNITLTSQWARWRIKSPASPSFTQPFIRLQIKENIKAPRHWPLCGDFTGDRWIPPTNGQ